MLPKVSKGFRAIFVAVMCVVCVALCVLAVRLAQQGEQLRLTQLPPAARPAPTAAAPRKPG